MSYEILLGNENDKTRSERVYLNIVAGIKIVKSLLPPKAVSSMKFVDSKNIREYISEECMLTSWGGSDDYTFQFEPETPSKQVSSVMLLWAI